MAKTVTVRLDEDTYELIRKAAAGERRSISNFMEYATVAYLSEESSVSDSEMQEILEDHQLVEELRRGRADIGKKALHHRQVSFRSRKPNHSRSN